MNNQKQNILVRSAVITTKNKSELGIKTYKIVKQIMQTSVEKFWNELKKKKKFCTKINNVSLDDFLQLSKIRKDYYALWIDSDSDLILKSAINLIQTDGILIYPNSNKDSFLEYKIVNLSKKWVYIKKN